MQSKFRLFFLSQIFNITLAVEKTESCQMHTYTVNHNVSSEVMMVDPINPILKSYKYVYVRAYCNSREAAKIGHQIKSSMITYLQNNPHVLELWTIQ